MTKSASHSETKNSKSLRPAKLILLTLVVIFLCISFIVFMQCRGRYLAIQSLKSAGGIIHQEEAGVLLSPLNTQSRRWLKDHLPLDIWRNLIIIRELAFTHLTQLQNAEQLKCIQNFPNVQTLSFDSTALTDDGLMSLQNLSELTILFASNTQITGSGLSHLKGSENLRYLFVFGTPFDDIGMSHVANFKKSEWLLINNTNVTDAGLSHISGLININHLNMNELPITDRGIQHLRGMTEMLHLHMGGTKIQDAGLIHLYAMTKMTDLEIRNNPQLSKEAVDKLRKALPKCKIYWMPKH